MSQRKDPPDQKAELVGKLCEQHHRFLLSYVRKGLAPTANPHDAEDVTQDIYKDLLRYKAKVAEARSRFAYLVRTARNAVIAFNRRHQRDRDHVSLDTQRDEDDAGDAVHADADASAAASVEARRDELPQEVTVEEMESALAQMKAEQRALIEMQLEGMSARKIAAKMGWTPDQAERRVTGARRSLKALLSDVMQGRVRK